MRASNGKQSELRREDWDFSTVPDEELETCYTYELARELKDWRSALAVGIELPESEMTPRLDSKGNPTFDSEGKIVFDVVAPSPRIFFLDPYVMHHNPKVRDGVRRRDFLRYPLVFRDDSKTVSAFPITFFPQTPWSLLPSDLRKEILEFVAQKERGAIRPIARFFKETKTIKKVELQINWEYTDGSLLENFQRWLLTNRPPDVAADLTDTRASWRDRLNGLGALRLRHHFSVEEATKLTSRILGKPLYSHRPAWEHAHKATVERFRRVFPRDGDPLSIAKKSNRKSRVPTVK